MNPNIIELFYSMNGLSVLNKSSYQRMLLRRRLMAVATMTTCIGVALFSLCVASTSWAIVEFSTPDNSSILLHVGVWGEHRIWRNGSIVQKEWIPYFPKAPPQIKRLTNLDLHHFHRTMAIFSLISLILMLTGNCFALYSFVHHRYTYKRLTAGLMTLVAMCVLVVVETVVHSVGNWRAISEDHALTYLEDYLQGLSYGYATYCAWVTLGIYSLAAVVFFIGSQKQKGNKAATQEFEVEDRPFNLGR